MISTLTSTARRCRPLRPLTAETGTHCPASGQWNPAGDRDQGQVFFEGSIMPSFGGEPVVWTLEPAADRQ
jgi:hypothetical protein